MAETNDGGGGGTHRPCLVPECRDRQNKRASRRLTRLSHVVMSCCHDDCSTKQSNQTEIYRKEHVVVPVAVSIHFSACVCRVMKNLCIDYTYATSGSPPFTMRSMMAPTSAVVSLYEPSDRAITISRSVISSSRLVLFCAIKESLSM